MNQNLFPGKAFISTTLQMLDIKRDMSQEIRQRYLMRAAMAGIIVGMLYTTNFAITAGFGSIELPGTTLQAVGTFLGAIFFGFALVFIYYSKSELLTSNMMIMSIGRYYRRITIPKALKVLGWCLLGNFIGGLLVAVMMGISTDISPSMLEVMDHSVAHKLSYVSGGASGIIDLLVRAIFCNFFINLAMLIVYNGFVKDDVVKVLVMMSSVFIFAYLGLEHSVANTVVFTMYAFQGSLDYMAALANVGIVLIGNYIGGGVLIGFYYAYVNDEARFLRKHPEVPDLDQA